LKYRTILHIPNTRLCYREGSYN